MIQVLVFHYRTSSMSSILTTKRKRWNEYNSDLCHNEFFFDDFDTVTLEPPNVQRVSGKLLFYLLQYPMANKLQIVIFEIGKNRHFESVEIYRGSYLKKLQVQQTSSQFESREKTRVRQWIPYKNCLWDVFSKSVAPVTKKL